MQISIRRILLLGAALCAIDAGAIFAQSTTHRDWSLKLPIVAVGRESNGAVEFNLGGKGTLSVEGNWTNAGEDYSKKEQEKYPNSSLVYSGQEFGLMYHRYVHNNTMSGFHWGLGTGYRNNTINWLKGSETVATEGDFYTAKAAGPTATLRGGYRWVSEDIGLMLGFYLNLRRFFASVKQQNTPDPSVGVSPAGSEVTYYTTAMSSSDKGYLTNRLATELFPGIELGWAF